MEQKKNNAFKGPSAFQQADAEKTEQNEISEILPPPPPPKKNRKKRILFISIGALLACLIIVLLTSINKKKEKTDDSVAEPEPEPVYTENGFFVDSAFAVSALRTYLELGNADENINEIVRNVNDLSSYTGTAEKADLGAVRSSQCFGTRFLIFAFHYKQTAAATVPVSFVLKGSNTVSETQVTEPRLSASGYLWVTLDELTQTPLPEGAYTLTLELDGKTAKTVRFTVVDK